ncbi:uncharacterized protein C8A04DRAFT_25039 [Dichotomopilus funicola]|uniref:Uncharacterized protein n=1 Tax=Dichotomopilus funicola TaxID=1934379 RepID=A0AAN6V9I3_9PEZI|nr:hypothetical protein C8A04DRAFT_25039 [Dichotomopilus funicola]
MRFHALIRTHHITSRKKVALLRKAAAKYECFALLRSGGCPGIMYCSGSEGGVRGWVDAVHRLRYKDYQLAQKPAPVPIAAGTVPEERSGLFEVPSVQEFAAAMEKRGVAEWWKEGMAFA